MWHVVIILSGVVMTLVIVGSIFLHALWLWLHSVMPTVGIILGN